MANPCNMSKLNTNNLTIDHPASHPIYQIKKRRKEKEIKKKTLSSIRPTTCDSLQASALVMRRFYLPNDPKFLTDRHA